MPACQAMCPASPASWQVPPGSGEGSQGSQRAGLATLKPPLEVAQTHLPALHLCLGLGQVHPSLSPFPHLQPADSSTFLTGHHEH